MSLEPPRYDVDEFGPLLDEYNPLCESYVAPRYDSDLRPLFNEEDDELGYAPDSVSAGCVPSESSSDVLLQNNNSTMFSHTPDSTPKTHNTQQTNLSDKHQPFGAHELLTNLHGSEFETQMKITDFGDTFLEPYHSITTPQDQDQTSSATDNAITAASNITNALSLIDEDGSNAEQLSGTLEFDPILLGASPINLDLAELDQYLNGPEPNVLMCDNDAGSKSLALVPVQSKFDAIMREDHL
ncbi:unnamed protein product, partial [Anisakis simplex]|uniref:TORC_C domain-containing protein n=1 Tax=Anisakis simplex TaxID=6269 RepID=A0A0M3JD28_ANISI